MALIHEPRCPNCGSALPMRVLWDFARVEQRIVPAFGFLNPRSGLLTGRIGIACPSCRATFRIVQTRIRVVRFLSWCAFVACAALIGVWIRRRHFVVDKTIKYAFVAAAVAAHMWLQSFLTPYLAAVRPSSHDESLSYPLKSAYDGPANSGSPPRAESGDSAI